MASAQKLRVLLAGGGTAGHIYPLVAVAKKIREKMGSSGLDVELRYFGEPGAYADYLAGSDIPVTRIASSKWRRYFSVQNYLDMVKLAFGFCQALIRMFFYMPDVVFSKG